MTLFGLLKLVHVASAIWFSAGLLGRWYALSAASRASELKLTRAFADLSGRFENAMVIPGSTAVLISGIVTALVGGLPLLGPIQGGSSWLLAALVIFAAVMALVPTVFLPRGKAFGAALEDAKARDQVTPGLRAAFADPLVVRAHWAELVGVGAILVLMVLKPF
jgi:predicted integral membrane protein DUF2269